MKIEDEQDDNNCFENIKPVKGDTQSHMFAHYNILNVFLELYSFVIFMGSVFFIFDLFFLNM